MRWDINGYNVPETLIELSVIWIIVFFAFRFLQGTRGGGVRRRRLGLKTGGNFQGVTERQREGEDHR